MHTADPRRTPIHRVGRFLGILALAAAAACTDGPASVPVDAPGAGPRAIIAPGPYVAGQMYTGRNGYIEYYAGNSPMIFAAPHGGLLEPDEIPLRNTSSTSCDASSITLAADMYTRQLAMEIRAAFYNRTGRYPHVIVNRVHRGRMDPNRDMRSGACQDPQADTAWMEYHEFLDTARARVQADHGRGWFTDVHGHAHPIKRLELGYMLEASDLRLSDATLDGSLSYENESSFRVFSAGTAVGFSRVLRGPASLGTLLDEDGFASVPSASAPAPLVGEAYFSGGFSTDRHGCANGSSGICGVQIEHDSTARTPYSARVAYAAGLVRAFDTYLPQNFGFNPGTGRDDIMVDDDNGNNDTGRAQFTAGASWTSAPTGGGTHLNGVRFSTGAAATEDSATFAFYVDTPGAYGVYARWPAATAATDSAVYRVVLPGAAPVDVTVNQRAGGQWTLLASGTAASGWGRVAILRVPSGSGTLAADAVRVVEQ